MTQEDKELLLKDLCSRLLYGVICKCYHTEFDEWDGKPFIAEYNDTLQNIDVNDFFLLVGGFSYEIDEIKPYLRPLSSMTEEEREELRQEQIKDEQLFTDCIKNHPEMRGLIIPHFASEWCDKNMFDHRGLIPKGLAIEVTKENNPYKK